ncbi:MAG: PD-(D/E)XK nuclease family protein [Candidatus Levybacteria bacterium]|nr:PD-(D/E)XK nuclease family protein [Candidatus Levybacteria bacterium]
MATDTYSSTWVSHSSIGDFFKCRKLYYLKHVYRDPISNHKITLINPYLALGQAVHETLESLSELGVEIRFKESLMEKFEETWLNFSGELGGFKNEEEEKQFKTRGLKMIKRVVDNPGPLLNKALRLKDKDPKFTLPRFKLSTEDDIILSGKIDWLEYVEKDDSVRIIDFKTSLNEEETGSLQLPIYCLLVKNCQNRKVSGVSYWYLEKDDKPTSLDLPDLNEAREEILSIALQIKDLRAKRIYKCLRGGCFACTPMERIIKGEGKLISHNTFQDIYIIKN